MRFVSIKLLFSIVVFIVGEKGIAFKISFVFRTRCNPFRFEGFGSFGLEKMKGRADCSFICLIIKYEG